MLTRIRSIGTSRAAAGLLTAAFIGLIAVPAVSAAEPAVSPANSDAATIARFVARHPLLALTVRADLTLVKRDGSTVLVHYEAGRVTAVSDTSITIRGRDGKGATFVVTDSTRVRVGGRPADIADVRVGDRAAVFGKNDDGTYTALLILARHVPTPASTATP